MSSLQNIPFRSEMLSVPLHTSRFLCIIKGWIFQNYWGLVALAMYIHLWMNACLLAGAVLATAVQPGERTASWHIAQGLGRVLLRPAALPTWFHGWCRRVLCEWYIWILQTNSLTVITGKNKWLIKSHLSSSCRILVRFTSRDDSKVTHHQILSNLCQTSSSQWMTTIATVCHIELA